MSLLTHEGWLGPREESREEMLFLKSLLCRISLGIWRHTGRLDHPHFRDEKTEPQKAREGHAY